MSDIVRAQRKALIILAGFARNQEASELLRIPAEASVPGTIDMVPIARKALDAILTAAMDAIAQESGGKEKTQKEVAAALLESETPFPDALVASLMGYAGHWRRIDIAEQLCWQFRGRRVDRYYDEEMTEYFQVEAYLTVERSQKSFRRKIDRIRERR